MGSSASKTAARTARQYPKHASPHPPPPARTPPTQPPHSAGPTVHPAPQAQATRTPDIDMDARDPDFASRLQQLGPVQPNPTYSPSSTTHIIPGPSQFQSYPSGPSSGPATGGAFPRNPAVMVLDARKRIADAVEQEMLKRGKKGFEGRTHVDVGTVRRALILRDEQGMDVGEVERHLGLKKGLVGEWGPRGTVEAA